MDNLFKLEHIGIAISGESEKKFWNFFLEQNAYKSEVVSSESVETHFYNIGESKIELLEAVDDKGTIEKYLRKRGPGIHHLAFAVKDIEKAINRIKARDIRVLNTTPKKGADNKLICFLHPKDTGGVLIELCMDRA